MKTQQRDTDADGGTQYRATRFNFNTRSACIASAVLVPLLFGLWSVMRGADGNWDLYNYHLYNAFAYFNNKLTVDFAPSGFQNYFNPILDLPYYLGFLYLPPRILAFAMGVLHGLNYVLLLGICCKVLPALPPADRYRVPMLLAMAGCLTVNFLSGIGNTMGDNATALFCLASLLLVLHHHDRVTPTALAWATMLWCAGLLMGLGSGLKLTNAVYAVALCAGLLSLRNSVPKRIVAAFLFGIGVLCGLGISAGPWAYTMWKTFGNPLFPQFGNIFPNPLALNVGVADPIWLPKTIWEQLLWPFLISLDANRVGQATVHQIIWAIVYALFIVLGFRLLTQRRADRDRPGLTWPAQYVLLVVALGFILWMKLFSIYRYLVPVELLAPLAVFIMMQRMTSYRVTRKATTGLLALATLVVLLGGVRSWGHESWGAKAYQIEIPPLDNPQLTTVVITEGDPPWAWLAMGFPASVAFTQIEGNFPKGPAFAQRVGEMVQRADGNTFALFRYHYDFPYEEALQRSQRANQALDALGLMNSTASCARLQWVLEKTRLKAKLVPAEQADAKPACRLQLLPGPDAHIDAKNVAERDTAQERLSHYGLTLGPERCQAYRAGLSASVRMYQWCRIVPASTARPSNPAQ